MFWARPPHCPGDGDVQTHVESEEKLLATRKYENRQDCDRLKLHAAPEKPVGQTVALFFRPTAIPMVVPSTTRTTAKKPPNKIRKRRFFGGEPALIEPSGDRGRKLLAYCE